MAYGTILASVADSEIDAFRSRERRRLKADKIFACSHLVAYWIKAQPLGRLLGEAIDGGEVLRKDLRHPFRPPMFQSPRLVRQLQSELRSAWDRVKAERVPPELLGFLGDEIPGVVEIFEHAGARSRGILTVLDPSDDPESPEIVPEES